MTQPHTHRRRPATILEYRAPRSGWLILCGVAVLLQLAVLYWPRVPGSPTGISIDKIVHVAVFAGPALAGMLAGVRARWVLSALLLHAPVSEVLQATALPGRSGDAGDVVADVAGVAVGGLAYVVWRRRQG